MDLDRHLRDDFWKNEERITNQIREAIQDGRDLRDEVERLDREDGARAKELIPGALRLKDVGRGFNVLMHAASVGSRSSFSSAVAVVNERLGRKGLVKQLRQSDIHGAPLVFHAAASSELDFFKSVCEIVGKALGKSELRQQLQAIDLNQRSILFYAAKGRNADVFQAAVDGLDGRGDLFQAFGGRGSGSENPRHAGDGEEKMEEKHGSPRESWLILRDHGQETANPVPGRVAQIGGQYVAADYKGMNILHVACRRGGPDIVEKVIREAQRQGESFMKDLLSGFDDRGSTPLMQAIRRDDHLDDLLHVLVDQNDNATLPKCEQLQLFTAPARQDHNFTSLMHAAYAGPNQLETVRKRIERLVKSCRPSASQPCDDHDGLDLDLALGVENEDDETKTIRRGNFLAAAVSGGHCCVLDEVVLAIKTGVLRRQHLVRPLTDNSQHDKRVEDAINAADRDMGTLLTVAISSRSKDAVQRTIDLIKVWALLSGREGGINNLAFAASMPEFPPEQGGNGIDMFDVVFKSLKEAAKQAFKPKHIDVLRPLFIPDSNWDNTSMQMPLARAMLSRNSGLFNAVYDSYNNLGGPSSSRWTRKQVLEQIPARSAFGAERANKLFLAAFGGAVLDNGISPTMLFAINKAIQKATPAADETQRHAEDRLTSQRLQGLIQGAVEVGAFDLFRCSPFYYETIPCLLKAIGDSEESVIDTIMLAIQSASNPFVVCAVASRYIDKAARDLPMHRDGLRLLQRKMDALNLEVLKELPNTVRGIGRAFGAHNSVLLKLKNDPETQKMYGRMCAKIGFVVMQWILEPRTVQETASRHGRNEGAQNGRGVPSGPAWMPPWEMRSTEYIDPLQRALDRGSQALNFVNNPLVLDYMLLKFSETIPPWTASNPFTYNMDEKFYTHTLHDTSDPSRVHKEIKLDDLKPADLLLRFLQGWSPIDQSGTRKLTSFRVPHETLLPGLQFTLAGIVGTPATFYGVPAIRYAYQLLSYIAMVGLFCSCVRIEDPRVITKNEICFYVFVLGLLWREILEFRDLLPTKHVLISGRDPAFPESSPPRRISTIVGRYLFQDAWNVLDSSTILCVAGAFVFRMIALRGVGGANQKDDNNPISDNAMGTPPREVQGPFLWAQVLLAVSAIPLFARILSLSQIDHTLGPMTQIIWTMLSHLGKFSVFVAVLMASFALTFHVLFYTCEDSNSTREDGLLYESFNTFGDSYLTMFKAMLGDFDFDSFKYANQCYRPEWAEEVGVTLLVLYLAIMAILLLNLLIAVLSTAHAEVHKNDEKEFHLARAKLIQHSWRASLKGRQPPPMNLLMPLAGLAADFVGEFWAVARRVCQHSRSTTKPFSETYLWDAFLGSVHRMVFAITVGSMSVVVNSILWMLSTPWLAWCIYRWWIQTLQDRSQDSWSAGYGRPLLGLLLNAIGWAVSMVFAAVLSIACSLGSVVLWVLGLWGIGQWWMNEIASRRRGRRPRQRDWVVAEKIVGTRNRGNLRDGERQFRVDLLLKETTGLDVEDVWLHIKHNSELARANVDE